MNRWETIVLWHAWLIVLLLSAPDTLAGFPDRSGPKDDILWDRVRRFDDIVIATVNHRRPTSIATSMQDKAISIDNSSDDPEVSRISIHVKRILKGKLPTGSMALECDPNLSRLLQARDKDGTTSYLLALYKPRTNRPFCLTTWAINGYLELDRFIVADKSIEQVVAAFLAADDDTPDAMFSVCIGLLRNEELSENAMQHVIELLSRLCGDAELPSAKRHATSVPTAFSIVAFVRDHRKELAEAVKIIQKRIRSNQNVLAGINFLQAIRKHDVALGITSYEEALAPYVRNALDRIDPEREWWKGNQVAACVDLLVAARDKKAITSLSRISMISAPTDAWRRGIVAAIHGLGDIGGREAEKELTHIRDYWVKQEECDQENHAVAEALKHCIGPGDTIPNSGK